MSEVLGIACLRSHPISSSSSSGSSKALLKENIILEALLGKIPRDEDNNYAPDEEEIES